MKEDNFGIYCFAAVVLGVIYGSVINFLSLSLLVSFVTGLILGQVYVKGSGSK